MKFSHFQSFPEDSLRLRVYNIEGKIFLKQSRHFLNIKQSGPAGVKTLTREQNKQTNKQTVHLVFNVQIRQNEKS